MKTPSENEVARAAAFGCLKHHVARHRRLKARMFDLNRVYPVHEVRYGMLARSIAYPGMTNLRLVIGDNHCSCGQGSAIGISHCPDDYPKRLLCKRHYSRAQYEEESKNLASPLFPT